MSGTKADDTAFVVRPWRPSDRGSVLGLLEVALGRSSEKRNEALFSWKHEQSPFGLSPAWIVEHEQRVVAFRTFMRWEFQHKGHVVSAVRAVDTVTHPHYQGRGLFTRLTRQALAELREQKVGFVFNTPNRLSRPGYLKMGWQVVGRLPIMTRVRSVTSLARMTAARRPAELWSMPTAAGEPAAVAFAHESEIRELVDAVMSGATQGFRTRLSPAFLQWRYGLEPLQYRVMPLGATLADGVLIFRVRRRGPAIELVVADILTPPRVMQKIVRSALRRSLRSTRADYALILANQAAQHKGMIPVPGQGPVLTWRGVNQLQKPPLSQWLLTLGDVELF